MKLCVIFWVHSLEGYAMIEYDWVDEGFNLQRGMQWLGGWRLPRTEGYAMNGWWIPPSRMIVSSTYVDLTGGTTLLFYEEKLRTSYVHLIWSLGWILILSSLEVQDDYTLVKFSISLDELQYLRLCIRFYMLVRHVRARYIVTCSV